MTPIAQSGALEPAAAPCDGRWASVESDVTPFRLSAVALALAAFVLPAAAQTPVYGYEIVKTYPHDAGAFTEGLFFLNGVLYESTGLEGRSTIRKVDLATGKVLQQRAIDPKYFGEGIVAWKGKLVELTWQTQVGFTYDLATFKPRATFRYKGEGWALTSDGQRLIMSDGTPQLRFLDPATLAETGRVPVTAAGKPVGNINELEYVKGEVLANIWQTPLIARIDPKTGHITGAIDLSPLVAAEAAKGRTIDVLNGIAYDAAHDRLFVTGKLWPDLYEIRIGPVKPGMTIQ